MAHRTETQQTYARAREILRDDPWAIPPVLPEHTRIGGGRGEAAHPITILIGDLEGDSADTQHSIAWPSAIERGTTRADYRKTAIDGYGSSEAATPPECTDRSSPVVIRSRNRPSSGRHYLDGNEARAHGRSATRDDKGALRAVRLIDLQKGLTDVTVQGRRGHGRVGLIEEQRRIDRLRPVGPPELGQERGPDGSCCREPASPGEPVGDGGRSEVRSRSSRTRRRVIHGGLQGTGSARERSYGRGRATRAPGA